MRLPDEVLVYKEGLRGPLKEESFLLSASMSQGHWLLECLHLSTRKLENIYVTVDPGLTELIRIGMVAAG